MVIVVIASMTTGALTFEAFRNQTESNALLAEMSEALASVNEDATESKCRGTSDLGNRTCRSIDRPFCYIYKSTGSSRQIDICDEEGNVTGHYTEVQKIEEPIELDLCRMVLKKEADLYYECNDYRSCTKAGGTSEPHESKIIWERVN